MDAIESIKKVKEALDVNGDDTGGFENFINLLMLRASVAIGRADIEERGTKGIEEVDLEEFKTFDRAYELWVVCPFLKKEKMIYWKLWNGHYGIAYYYENKKIIDLCMTEEKAKGNLLMLSRSEK